ncbi:MAG: DNA recombination protein RmuC [Gammaproteobacteria bacterium]|jgi:DNA recombination protein RmuC|nr:DNA recombination protein RmuC [Gammaproteobacteria bacterium]
MPATQMIVLLLFFLLLLCFSVIIFFYKKNQNLQENLNQERNLSTDLKIELSRQETLLQEESNHHLEKLKVLENSKAQMTAEFKNLANEILEQKSKAFTESNKKNIESILTPLNEKIQGFEKKVEETYDKEAKERFSLTEQIKNLQTLNVQISQDAINLTNALKGENKTQGIWGEMILERVLEQSGLNKGREYEVQASFSTDTGEKKQPDVIVHLPENKDVIIDSKVSLVAYEKYSNADSEEDRKTLLKQHVQSLKGHIKNLSSKSYEDISAVKSLDYVLLFLPIEAAFTLAIQEDNDLFTEALNKNIILVGPSTLLAILRTIQNIWRFEHQNKNAIEIATSAGRLYDKFVNFVENLEEIGKHIQRSQDSYDAALNKLNTGRGNLISRVERLKALGANTKKSLPENLLSEKIENSKNTAAIKNKNEIDEDAGREIKAKRDGEGEVH